VNRKTVLSAIAGFFISIYLLNIGCTKIDVTQLGDDLIPVVDNINTFDTLVEVISNNIIFPDSANKIAVGRSQDQALGTVNNDPLFGHSTASMFFELKPLVYNFYPFLNKDSIIAIDSVVMTLGFNGFYGDSTIPQNVRLYELASPFKFRNDTLITINSPYNYFQPFGTLLSSTTIDVRTVRDKYYINRGSAKIDSFVNQVRIKLPPASAAYLGNKFRTFDTSNAYKNDSLYRENFRGFGLVADSAANPLMNTMMFLNYADDRTKMYFYFRIKRDNGTIDTTFTTLSYTFFSVSSNLVHRNYIPSSEIRNHTTILPGGDPQIYLQTTPGTYAELKMPGLQTMYNRVIHRAELVFEQLPTGSYPDDIFTAPGYMYIDAIDTNAAATPFPLPVGLLRPPASYSFFPFNGLDFDYFGGTRKEKIVNGNKVSYYNINLTRFVQKIITDKRPDYKMRLYAPNLLFYPGFGSGIAYPNRLAVGRVRIAGGNHPDPNKRMKLRIIYSKL
jgi:Domain of unknown function (DUF4270)